MSRRSPYTASSLSGWKKLLPFLFVLLLPPLFDPVGAAAQEEALTLREAVRIGLAQNRRGEIASLQTERAREGATPGAAGLLPEVDLYGGLT